MYYKKERREVEVAVNVAAAKYKGQLTPELLIKEAQPQDNPLHDEFTWDNSRAGHLWRINEARNILRAYAVKRPGAQSSKGRMFYFIRPVEGETKKYVRSADVFRDPELTRQAALAAYQQFQKSLTGLKPFPQYFGHLLEVIERECAQMRIDEKPRQQGQAAQ